MVDNILHMLIVVCVSKIIHFQGDIVISYLTQICLANKIRSLSMQKKSFQ